MSYVEGFREGYAGTSRKLSRVSNEFQLNPTQGGWMAVMDATHDEANAYRRWQEALVAPPVEEQLPYVLLGRFMVERFSL